MMHANVGGAETPSTMVLAKLFYLALAKRAETEPKKAPGDSGIRSQQSGPFVQSTVTAPSQNREVHAIKSLRPGVRHNARTRNTL